MAFLFYQIVRLEFYLWNFSNYSIESFSEVLKAFVYGLRFDALAVVWFSTAPLIFSFFPWYGVSARKQSQLLVFCVLLLQFPAILLGMIDTEYIHFLGRRWSFDSLFLVVEAKGKMGAFISTHWHLMGISILLMIVYWILGLSLMKQSWMTKIAGWSSKISSQLWSHILICFSVLVWAIVLARGGFQEKPLSFAHAHLFPNVQMNNLVMNTGFSLLKTWEPAAVRPYSFFTDRLWLGYLNGRQGAQSLFNPSQFQEKPNIVLIVMESFGTEYLGLQDPSFTPFLDSLIPKSLYFKNSFANARRSIDGIGALLTGIPSLMSQPLIASVYQGNEFAGAGTLLKQNGYQTAFFHGANRGSMFFDQFMPRVGVDTYYGAQEFPDPSQNDGTWGIYDEPFMLWMADKISSELKPPFFVCFFSLTSHHPFRVPEKYKETFPKGELEILSTIAYSDLALKKFFEAAEKQSWFKDTIFIITGDHTSKNFRPEFRNELSAFRVPLIIYSPTTQFPEVDLSAIVQHIDVMPTVLDVAGIQNPKPVLFGRSVFSPGDRTAVFYTGSSYLFNSLDVTGIFNFDGDFEFYEKEDHGFQKKKITDFATKETRTNQFKATLEYFSRGLLENKLTEPEHLMR
ncbi:MAG: LTA synthase family protein [Pseudobdellovibrionaceae bacterium]